MLVLALHLFLVRPISLPSWSQSVDYWLLGLNSSRLLSLEWEMLHLHSSFFSVRIPRDLFGVCGIGPSGSLVRWIFTGSVSPRVCHSCLPSWYFTGDLVFPCWSDFLSRTPRGFVLCWAGCKFLPSFLFGLGGFLQGVPPPGLALLLPPLVCN